VRKIALYERQIGVGVHGFWHHRSVTQRPPLVVDPATGLLQNICQVLSPHFDARPGAQRPQLLVVHGISLPPGEYADPWIDRLFTGSLPPDAHPYFEGIAALRVSSHALIRRDGTIRQYVPFSARAWHAGQSSYLGREHCNDFSIGIELEGVDDAPYADAQYLALTELTRALLRAYSTLSADRVVGHSDIAPGRKSDPGVCFDWRRYRASLPLPELR